MRSPKTTRRDEERKPQVTMDTPDVDDLNEDQQEELLIKLAERKGIKLMKQEEFNEAVSQASETSVEKAARELGIDLDEIGRNVKDKPSLDQIKLVDDLAKQIDIVMTSTAFVRGALPFRDKESLYAIRVALRQIRGETPPLHQAGTIAELLSGKGKIPTGVFDTLGKPRKPIFLTPQHLEAAGIG